LGRDRGSGRWRGAVVKDDAQISGRESGEGEGRGNVPGGGEVVHGLGDAISAEEADGLLGAVSEEDNAKSDAERGEDRVIGKGSTRNAGLLSD
jgi:hypothetical protein